MTTALEPVRPVAVPGRVGQGTAVEQSRAIAEVQAQVIVAQQMPRDINRADRDMKRSCAMKGLAEKAFYRYRRAGTQITGPSVQLAREMARCWGNIQYGITELRRDDEHGQSEMLAFAWDLETNTRSATTFIVVHVRDTTNGTKTLTDQRDIYENNANNGARRLREMIFAILPGWYTEDAVAACYATLAADDSDGATLEERAANAAAKFAASGIKQAQLENKMGAPMARWSPSDLAQLTVIWRSAERGETTLEAEFGVAAPAVTAADITGQQGQQKPPARKRGKQQADPAPDEPPWPEDAAAGSAVPAAGPAAPSGDKLATDGQVGMIRGKFEQLGYKDDSDPAERDARLSATARLAGLDGPLATTRDLTGEQAARVIRRIRDLRDAVELTALLEDGEVPGGE